MNERILVDDSHDLHRRDGLHYAVFSSEYLQIRYYTLLLVKNSNLMTDERLLLEQQVSELVKNAVKHGNKCDTAKNVKIWYKFTDREARFIVQDEGPGFADIEKWNIFNEKRQEYVQKQDFSALMNYASWRTSSSDKYDGGNAMFAALEYWNMGVVYSSARNTVAVGKRFALDIMESGDDE